MKHPKQPMRIVMDESDAPYEEGQYTPTLKDDISIVRLAKKHGLEFMPGSDLHKLSQSMYGDA